MCGGVRCFARASRRRYVEYTLCISYVYYSITNNTNVDLVVRMSTSRSLAPYPCRTAYQVLSPPPRINEHASMYRIYGMVIFGQSRSFWTTLRGGILGTMLGDEAR